ncbi:hypothetical protein [Dactylosporangium sp. CS-033363]
MLFVLVVIMAILAVAPVAVIMPILGLAAPTSIAWHCLVRSGLTS